MKRFSSKTQKKGRYGEKVCKKFLISQGFQVLEENYTCFYGEVDLVVKKRGMIHFIEVKSLFVNKQSFVSHETYNPFENVTEKKIQRFRKAVYSYLRQNKVSHETYQCDVYVIYIDLVNKKHLIDRLLSAF